MTHPQSISSPGLDADRQSRARADARRLLERRKRRIGTIRKRAVGGSVAAFAAAWAVVGFQLVSGNDPALSHNGKPAVVASTPAAKSKRHSSASTGSTQSSSPSKSSSQRLAPVTTQQS